MKFNRLFTSLSSLSHPLKIHIEYSELQQFCIRINTILNFRSVVFAKPKVWKSLTAVWRSMDDDWSWWQNWPNWSMDYHYLLVSSQVHKSTTRVVLPVTDKSVEFGSNCSQDIHRIQFIRHYHPLSFAQWQEVKRKCSAWHCVLSLYVCVPLNSKTQCHSYFSLIHCAL